MKKKRVEQLRVGEQISLGEGQPWLTVRRLDVDESDGSMIIVVKEVDSDEESFVVVASPDRQVITR